MGRGRDEALVQVEKTEAAKVTSDDEAITKNQMNARCEWTLRDWDVNAEAKSDCRGGREVVPIVTSTCESLG